MKRTSGGVKKEATPKDEVSVTSKASSNPSKKGGAAQEESKPGGLEVRVRALYERVK